MQQTFNLLKRERYSPLQPLNMNNQLLKNVKAEIKEKIKLSESVSDLELEILYLIEECERLNNALSEISKILKTVNQARRLWKEHIGEKEQLMPANLERYIFSDFMPFILMFSAFLIAYWAFIPKDREQYCVPLSCIEDIVKF